MLSSSFFFSFVPDWCVSGQVSNTRTHTPNPTPIYPLQMQCHRERSGKVEGRVCDYACVCSVNVSVSRGISRRCYHGDLETLLGGEDKEALWNHQGENTHTLEPRGEEGGLRRWETPPPIHHLGSPQLINTVILSRRLSGFWTPRRTVLLSPCLSVPQSRQVSQSPLIPSHLPSLLLF